MNRMLRTLAAVLVLMLAVVPPSLADLQRGDEGEGVWSIQEMLFQQGFLAELPDGVFGRKTESAVRSFQDYSGMEVTGIVTDEVLDALQTSYYEETLTHPNYCTHYETPEGSTCVDYCETHSSLSAEATQLLATGKAEDAAAACDLWMHEIERLYDVWTERADESERGAVLLSKAAAVSAMKSQREALSVSDRGEETTFDRLALELSWREQASWLCMMLGRTDDAANTAD